MNPAQNDPDNTPISVPVTRPEPTINSETFVPLESTPESDIVALHAIETIEAEPVAHSFEPVALGKPDVPVEPAVVVPATPFSAPVPIPEQPTLPTVEPIVQPSINPVVQPVTLVQEPTKKKRALSKKMILIIAVIIIVAAAVAIFALLQQSNAPIETNSQQTSGDQPGGTIIDSPSDSSLN
jgi:hypothetical protein